MIEILRIQEFENWLIVQSAKTQALVESRLFRLEYYGHFGDSKSLGGGMCELRSRNGIRIYFTGLGNAKILILYGGDKNGQKKDIKKARALLRRFTKEET